MRMIALSLATVEFCQESVKNENDKMIVKVWKEQKICSVQKHLYHQHCQDEYEKQRNIIKKLTLGRSSARETDHLKSLTFCFDESLHSPLTHVLASFKQCYFDFPLDEAKTVSRNRLQSQCHVAGLTVYIRATMLEG